MQDAAVPVRWTCPECGHEHHWFWTTEDAEHGWRFHSLVCDNCFHDIRLRWVYNANTGVMEVRP